MKGDDVPEVFRAAPVGRVRVMEVFVVIFASHENVYLHIHNSKPFCKRDRCVCVLLCMLGDGSDLMNK